MDTLGPKILGPKLLSNSEITLDFTKVCSSCGVSQVSSYPMLNANLSEYLGGCVRAGRRKGSEVSIKLSNLCSRRLEKLLENRSH